MRKILAAIALVAISSTAQAATVSEADFGGFSSDAKKPSEITRGTAFVSGTGEKGDSDFLHFSGLGAGSQDIYLDFGFVADKSPAGRSVNYVWRFDPFPGAWQGVGHGNVSLGRHKPTDKQVISLGENFQGDLFLQLTFNSGTGTYYNISTSGGAASPGSAAVPLPAGMVLILTALGSLGFVARRRRMA